MKKVTIIETCFGKYIDIDGVDFNDFPQKEIVKYIKEAVQKMEEYELRELFENIAYNKATDVRSIYRDSCDQCGDWNSKTELILGNGKSKNLHRQTC